MPFIEIVETMPPAPERVYLKDYQPPAFWVRHVDLYFRLRPKGTSVTATLTLERNPDHPNPDTPLILHGQGLSLITIYLNDYPLNDKSGEYTVTESHLTVFNPPPGPFKLITEVVIQPADNTALEGLYLSAGNFCTQCEAEGFRRITFYPDRPDVLAPFDVRIEADAADYPVLLANGNRLEAGPLPNGRHYAVWQDPFPKPSYLFALVAGQLHPVRDRYTTQSGRRVQLEIWVEKENLHKCAHALESLKKAMRWDEQAYGREYDLDIYMIVAVNDFNMGAMENKGLNIFNSACVLADPVSETDQTFHSIESIVAHEYLHNWSGNRVTCRDWFQLSLKEGFTVYRDQQFSAAHHSPAVERIEQVSYLRTAQFAEDASPTAHPVQPDSYVEINNFYTLTIYEKGAEIVRMLAELLGPEAFRAGSERYFERFDGQAVTIEDFVHCLTEQSDLDHVHFMRWYQQAGTPQIQASGQYDPDRCTYQLTLKQHTPATPGQPHKEPLLIPIKLALIGPSGQNLAMEVEGELWGQEKVYQLTEAETTLTFHHLQQAPLPSLLRGFSAPVKLDFPYSEQELAFLMAHDSDGFNRWDAGQRLAIQQLNQMIQALQQGQTPALSKTWLEALSQLLDQPVDDPHILALQLSLPSEPLLLEQQVAPVDVDILHQASLTAKQTLGQQFYAEFKRLYHAFDLKEPWSAEPRQIAARRLKNVCLGYLLISGKEEARDLALTQYYQADNMTDQQAALTALVHAENAQWGEAALSDFAQRWRQDAQVMDTWFRIQVTRPWADALDRVKTLSQHPAFSLKNPNKVRALLSSFAQANLSQFHRADGASYDYLAEQVIHLDPINPQMAARLVTPLTRFSKLDEARQEKMRQALGKIRQQSFISPDLFEMLDRALNA